MQYLRHIIIATFGLLFLQTVWAGSATQDLVRDLDANQCLTGSFEQTIATDSTMALIKSTGHFALQRPGKFNWTITAPNPQKIIADGRLIYVYDEGLAQVTISNQKNTAKTGSPAMFLIGDTNEIARDYNVVESGGTNQLTYTITPNKKNQSNSLFDKLLITFKKQASENKIECMHIVDSLGGDNIILFKNLTKETDSKAFVFISPPGVEVIKRN